MGASRNFRRGGRCQAQKGNHKDQTPPPHMEKKVGKVPPIGEKDHHKKSNVAKRSTLVPPLRAPMKAGKL